MKNKDRHRNIVKIARIYQKISPSFNYIEQILFYKYYNGELQNGEVVCILAPPRSGSTLTYQFLTSQLENFHLTNFTNLLYSTPLLGYKLNKLMCKSQDTKFKSNQGFVNGLCGEAEGLRFWEYWTGQGLDEVRKIKLSKANKLSNVINFISNKNEIPFITGYLGHVFLIKELRKIFPKIIFLHLTRDLLSNANSIIKQSPESWFSVKPINYKSWLNLTREEQVINQILSIHSQILKNSEDDTIVIDYRDICQEPEKVLMDIITFAQSKDICLKLKEDRKKIESFNYSYVKEDKLAIKDLKNIILNKIELNKAENKDFFYNLLKN